ncbi:MAG: response regulator [Anaerolineae bacterium]|nr:response regulator [Anaerolineae bacterium]
MNKKILIVDDEPHIRILLEQALEDLEYEGVELILAADGREGLETALNEKPDLIFLDVMMPYMSGYEVCQHVKQAGFDTHVILLTAKGQAVDKERGSESGADQYVTKPFDPDYIVERACEVLGIDL